MARCALRRSPGGVRALVGAVTAVLLCAGCGGAVGSASSPVPGPAAAATALAAPAAGGPTLAANPNNPPIASVQVQVTVPGVVGVTVAEAREMLQDAGLQPGVEPPDAPGDAIVTHQFPLEGVQLDAGGVVAVLVVPWLDDPAALVGSSLAEIRGQLDEVVAARGELLLRSVQQWRTEPEEPPVGDDAAFVSSPPTDCPDPRQVCTITVALQARVPDLSGSTLDEARDAVIAAGLTLDAAGDTDDPAAGVADQDPAAGQLADFGTPVRVGLAGAPAAPPARWPPDVTDRWLAEAQQDLRAAQEEQSGAVPAVRVALDPRDIPVPPDRAWVVAQSDDCTGSADACTVTLAVQAVAPDLEGLTAAQAQAQIEAAGLRLGTVQGSDAADATVTVQSPGPDSRVPFGSAVAVTVELAAAPGIDPWWIVAGLLGAAVLAAAAAGVRAAGHRRGRPWVRQHVQVQAAPGAASQTVQDVPGEGRTHRVQIIPEPGTTAQDVEEVDEP